MALQCHSPTVVGFLFLTKANLSGDKRRTRDTTGGPLVMTWCSMLQRTGCGVRVGSKAPGYVEKISSRRTSFLTIGSIGADVVAFTVQLCKGCGISQRAGR